jgi:hypothetical protein
MTGPAPDGTGPWQPGIRSPLPAAFLPLATIFRPENVRTSLAEAQEQAAFTGLEPEELVELRPDRLVVHELLIRVTGDISVPDGQVYADLGINFRRMVATIHRSLLPRLPAIAAEIEGLRRRLEALIAAELARTLGAPPPLARSQSGLGRWLPWRRAGGAPPAEPRARERQILADWAGRAEAAPDPLEQAALRALERLAAALAIRHGRIPGDPALLTRLAARLAGNEASSVLAGRLIEPALAEIAAREGYRRLPAQARPVIMNVKGASAAGKSTMRPLQRRLAAALGVDWADFALISPDIWRKYLLDYDRLGPAHGYAGTLTGHELKIIDQKLDRHMAEKALQGRIPHLLIDRFRFDSFAEKEGEAEGSRLLTRFGDTVYMVFMITPPEATVERAWLRGLQFGRFKAVEDLLDHNVEAYAGMPRLFFTWTLRRDKRVHCEFLDNSVPLGERPRTVAFGWNGELNVLDLKAMLDVERFRRINLRAKAPAELYPDPAQLAAARNAGFLRQCARLLPAINLADWADGLVYLRLEAGRPCWADPAGLARAMAAPATRAGLLALLPELATRPPRPPPAPQRLDPAQAHTLGQWGGQAARLAAAE